MTPSRTTATRSVVEELLRRIGEGDPERIGELYAEQGDWKRNRPEDEHGRTGTPWIRHRSTRADAVAHYQEPAAHHVPEEADTRIERILVDGDDAVVLGDIRQTAAPTGRAHRPRPPAAPTGRAYSGQVRPAPHRPGRPGRPPPRVRGQPRRRARLRAGPGGPRVP
ncbi:ketosteroid isomerase [Streptomyces cellostaticus]|nr:ketosteroid isomerase [Streptomyces cellostaticus]